MYFLYLRDLHIGQLLAWYLRDSAVEKKNEKDNQISLPCWKLKGSSLNCCDSGCDFSGIFDK